VTDKPPNNSVGRRICDFRFSFYASRKYLDKHGDRPLQDHDWVLTDAKIDWLIPMIWKKRTHAKERIVLASTLTLSAVNAAKEGMGVVLCPAFSGMRKEGSYVLPNRRRH